MCKIHIANNNRSTNKYHRLSAQSRRWLQFSGFQRRRGCLVSLVCLPSSPWSSAGAADGRCHRIWLQFLPFPPPYSLSLSLSDQLPNEERKEGENKFVFESSPPSPSSSSRSCSYAFPASNSCCCYTERGGVVARNDISEGKSQNAGRYYLLKELCGSYHCLIAIRTNTLFCH